jgi:hypothetical protein
MKYKYIYDYTHTLIAYLANLNEYLEQYFYSEQLSIIY